MNGLQAAVVTFVACFFLMPLAGAVLRGIGLYTIVQERRCHVYLLFGKVVGIIDEPGLHFLWPKLGSRALILWMGSCQVLDMRVDQRYLRSLAVNSEEGAPMGIGIWYEMYVSDPVSYLFKNADPKGSLAANVSNAAVRCLSNMPLADMMEDRHGMSQAVRAEVSPKSQEWGYSLGSVYIRKVHFRDAGMIHQIEEKVVNRLRQVTSAIKQDGANQVNIIASTAERTAATEFAKADAIRPQIVGAALQRISQDEDVAKSMFEILEIRELLGGGANVTLVPSGRDGILTDVLAAATPPRAAAPAPAVPAHAKAPDGGLTFRPAG